MPPPEAAALAPGDSRLSGHVGRALERTTTAALWAAERPFHVLGALLAIHWLALLAFALTVRHNGLVFYQGGDQIGLTTDAWLLAHGHLPPTVLGFGWPLLLLPFGWIASGDFVSFLPYAIGLNAVVLAPVALYCIYSLAARVGGRVLGLWAAALWVAAPYLAIPFFRADYHERFVEQFLPQALGLTALADYPSMVCLLVAATLAVRALDARDWSYAALAGLAAGFAIAIKPSNALFLAAPVVLYVLGKRPRLVVPYAAAVLPMVILLTLWKYRGLGDLPLFALEETRLASETVVGAVDTGRYLDLDWVNFRQNMAHLREFFWSVRVLQWLPIAGAFAVARRSVPVAGLLVAWFGAFLVLKGTPALSTVESGSFFRFLMPAYPAYFLLAACLPLLVPGVARRVPGRLLPPPPPPVARRTLLIVVAVALLLPLVAVAAPRPLSRTSPEALTVSTIVTPVDSGISVAVRADGESRTLTWSHRDFGSTAVFYRVYRTAADGADFNCLEGGSADCRLELLLLGTTRARTFTDLSPPANALYRIGIATNWRDDPTGGDVIAISPPIPAGG